jgi:hypothetical protein
LKKNLILFFVALSLGVFTYFFQELEDRQDYDESEKRGTLLDPQALGELKGFSLPGVKISKQGTQYLLLSGEIVDERKVDWFMSILSGIKMKRVLPKDSLTESSRENFFPEENEKVEFLFEKGKVTFILGKKLDFDQSFYMEVINGDEINHVVAFDSGPLDTVYEKKEGHRSDHRFRRFQSLFYLDEVFFRDYRIFRHWMNKKWSLLEVELDSRRNRKFSLNFTDAQTTPKIPFFLAGEENEMRKFEELLVELKGKSYAQKVDADFEKEPLAVMTVNSSQGEARLTLIRSKRDKKAYFLRSGLDEKTYLIEDKYARLFFKPVQDFWNLKAVRTQLKTLTVRFPSQEKSTIVSFSREDGKFMASAPSVEASHQAFSQLVKFLAGKADYWVAGKDYEQAYIKQFILDWGFGPFFLMIRSGEILLYHKESGHGLVYKITGSPKFPMVKEQYFYE